VCGRRGGKPDKTAIEAFIKSFVQIYTGHGGRVENKSPALYLAATDDVGRWVSLKMLEAMRHALTYIFTGHGGMERCWQPVELSSADSSVYPARQGLCYLRPDQALS